MNVINTNKHKGAILGLAGAILALVIFYGTSQGGQQKQTIFDVKEKPHFLVVGCVGDSLTFGDGSHNGTITKDGRGNYPLILQSLLADASGTLHGAKVLNFGLGGTPMLKTEHWEPGKYFFKTQASVWGKPMEAFAEARPDIAVVMLGTNDAKIVKWTPESAAVWVNDYVELLRRVQNSTCAMKVLIPPFVVQDMYGISELRLSGYVIPLIEIAFARWRASENFTDGWRSDCVVPHKVGLHNARDALPQKKAHEYYQVINKFNRLIRRRRRFPPRNVNAVVGGQSQAAQAAAAQAQTQTQAQTEAQAGGAQATAQALAQTQEKPKETQIVEQTAAAGAAEKGRAATTASAAQTKHRTASIAAVAAAKPEDAAKKEAPTKKETPSKEAPKQAAKQTTTTIKTTNTTKAVVQAASQAKNGTKKNSTATAAATTTKAAAAESGKAEVAKAAKIVPQNLVTQDKDGLDGEKKVAAVKQQTTDNNSTAAAVSTPDQSEQSLAAQKLFFEQFKKIDEAFQERNFTLSQIAPAAPAAPAAPGTNITRIHKFADGVHLNAEGSRTLANFISDLLIAEFH